MTSTLPTDVTILNPDGTTRLALTEAAGYEIVFAAPAVGRSWRRETTSSPFVHGTHQVRATLDAESIDVQVRIKRPTWAQVEGTVQALLDAVEPDDLLLRVKVGGVTRTWKANAPDIVDAFDKFEAHANRRTVGMRFPVQPNPTVTGTA